jgi:hypothetical protein
MIRISLLAGAAALAIAAPAAADKGGKGGGHGNHSGNPHAVQGEPHGGGHGRNKGRGHGGEFRDDRASVHVERHGSDHALEDARFSSRASTVLVRDADGIIDDRDRRNVEDRVRFLASGPRCPPGLAKKHNGCLPPCQAKKLFRVGDRLEPAWFSASAFPTRYRNFYSDTADSYYRYDDWGRIYRVDSGSNQISGLIPLLGGGFAVGQPLPAGYDIYNVPYQYRTLYPDSGDTLYRYGDNAIYGVDPKSGMIESIVALLTGDLSVGQPLPAGYDVYNLPIDYRDRYADNDDSLYRYADGNIYQVDAKTQIIEAIVEMLV